MAKRNDNSGYLYHWIKAVPFMRNNNLDYSTAFEVLINIIRDGAIRAGLTMEAGGHECICFTESTKYSLRDDTSKYQPFGFEFSKRRVFTAGGRPVIYSPIAEKQLLDPVIQWRFMPFDLDARSESSPFGIDFTWEREWRLNEPELSLDEVSRIFVPNERYRELLIDRTNDIVSESISEDTSDYYYGYPHPGVEDYIDSIHERIDVLRID
ncbi:TPA: hypothetical protein MYH88_000991 [Klebsiella pneumoniae]|nr:MULTISPECIES: hypothetical protein [Klebsiella]EKX4113651.1 hypothetical protein [Klebsiella pneumoniae]MCE7333486.1 hypothetical protein [Klebsiella pneumoniae]MDK1765284.1 hypothetical protein [Klebsiella pneumoniae]MEE4426454.1 hypothetical protein [Klebsiella pneumoniae]MRD57254.1 hypothetical protein [Klebsiella pneumoniae]